MSLIGLDFGEKRVGVAIAEPDSYVSVPLKVLSAKDRAGLEAYLKALACERRAKAIVVGVPIQTDGKEGDMALKVKGWAISISSALNLPVHFVDERFTSKEAKRAMAEAGAHAKKRKSLSDAVSAALILDTFISRSKKFKRGASAKGEVIL